MVYLTWLVHPKIYNNGKGLKFRNSKSTFHLLLIFEQGSPIGTLALVPTRFTTITTLGLHLSIQKLKIHRLICKQKSHTRGN